MNDSKPNLTRRFLLAGLIVLIAVGVAALIGSQALAATGQLENSLSKDIRIPYVMLTGQVTDVYTLLPIAGARLELDSGDITYTDANGIYSFTVDMGYYTVTASADQYVTQVLTDVYVYGGTVVQDFALQHLPIDLAGEVTNANSLLPIEGAKILLDTGEFTFTDQDGQYAFSLQPGVYTATASADGYESETVANIELIDQPVEVDFSLFKLIAEPVVLSGMVTDFYYTTPIQGAMVLLDTGTFDITTAGGMYSFSLEPGFYTMTVSADGYITQVMPDVELVSGNVMVNFALVPLACPTITIEAVEAEVEGLTLTLQADIDSVLDLTYLWDFGDGLTSTQAAPVHIYPSYGVYPVTLQVANFCGTTASWEGEVIVPVWSFLPVAAK